MFGEIPPCNIRSDNFFASLAVYLGAHERFLGVSLVRNGDENEGDLFIGEDFCLLSLTTTLPNQSSLMCCVDNIIPPKRIFKSLIEFAVTLLPLRLRDLFLLASIWLFTVESGVILHLHIQGRAGYKCRKFSNSSTDSYFSSAFLIGIVGVSNISWYSPMEYFLQIQIFLWLYIHIKSSGFSQI